MVVVSVTDSRCERCHTYTHPRLTVPTHNQSINQPTNQSTHQSINQPTARHVKKKNQSRHVPTQAKPSLNKGKTRPPPSSLPPSPPFPPSLLPPFLLSLTPRRPPTDIEKRKRKRAPLPPLRPSPSPPSSLPSLDAPLGVPRQPVQGAGLQGQLHQGGVLWPTGVRWVCGCVGMWVWVWVCGCVGVGVWVTGPVRPPAKKKKNTTTTTTPPVVLGLEFLPPSLPPSLPLPPSPPSLPHSPGTSPLGPAP